MTPEKFRHRYRQTKVFKQIFTRNGVQSILSDINDETFKKHYDLAIPGVPFHYGDVVCQHSSLYIAGMVSLYWVILLQLSLLSQFLKFLKYFYRVTEEVKVAASSSSTQPSKRPPPGPLGARKSGLSGLTSILGGKKQKLSTLEKSKLDWESFKKDEGIGEDLKTFNQGKQGFLERQAFLERADHKQFEIERNLRLGRKSNR